MHDAFFVVIKLTNIVNVIVKSEKAHFVKNKKKLMSNYVNCCHHLHEYECILIHLAHVRKNSYKKLNCTLYFC